MTGNARNLFLSLVISLSLAFVLSALYVFYPILWLIVGGTLRGMFSSNTDSNGIAAVAGGVSERLLLVTLLTAPVLFVIILILLQRWSRRS